MLIPSIVQQLLFVAVFVAILVTAFTSVRAFLFLLGFTIPLMIPRVDIGVGLDWYKLVGPIAVGLALFNGRGVGARASRTSSMLIFVAYAVIVSTIWMFLEYNYLERYRLAAAMEMGGGLAQNRLKMPVQLGSFIGQVLAVFAVPLWARNQEECSWAVDGAVGGVITSVVAGGISWLATGLATVNTSGLQGVLVYSDYSIARLGGLSGEPKLLGASLAVVLMHFMSRQVFGKGPLARTWAFAFVAAALFATFSTSAWAAAAGGLVVVALIALTRPSSSRLGLLAIIFGSGALLTLSVGFVGSMLESRGFGRIFGESGDLDQQKDMYVFRVFSDQPGNAVFGYGLGGVDLAVIPYVEWLHLKYKRTPTPAITGVRLLGDLGAMGVALLYGLAISWARRLRRSGDHIGAGFMVAGLTTALLGSMIGLTEYFFLAGATLTANHIRNQLTPTQ
ncbi:MAG: hypothetical protein AB7K71_10440 [Polyangiaceae bacterium]